MTDDDDNDASCDTDRSFCYHHDIYDAQDTPGKVQIEAAMFWVIMALLLVIFAVVPGVADLCARLLGIYSTPNFLFLFMIFLLIVKAFGMTIQLSQLESKQRADPENGSGTEIPGRKRGRAGRTGSCVRNMQEKVNKNKRKNDEKEITCLAFLWPFAVFLLGIWHLLDVQASVTETGHHWLYGWYGGLFFVSMVILIGFGVLIFGKK